MFYLAGVILIYLFEIGMIMLSFWIAERFMPDEPMP